LHARDYPADSSGDERIGTRPSAALMGTWLEVYVQNAPASFFCRLLQGKNLGVFDACEGVGALANQAAFIIENHSSHARIGRA
jgi:hypothetical protein